MKIRYVVFVVIGLLVAICSSLSILPILKCLSLELSYSGAVIGGCLSGVFTLLGAIVTIEYAKKELKEQIKAQEDNRKRENNSKIINRITELIGEFETNQAKYFFDSIRINSLEKGRVDSRGDKELDKELRDQINRLRFLNGGIRVDENRSFFVLKMYLSTIPEADKLLQKVIEIHDEENKVINEYDKSLYGEMDLDELPREWIERKREELENEFYSFYSPFAV